MPEDDEQKENTIMGGIFGVASKSSCILDLFFGIDYHSHLGTRRGGMAVYDKKRGFDRVIHNIENAPFRTKFDGDIGEMREIWESDVFQIMNLSLFWCALILATLQLPQLERSITWMN